MTVVDHKRDVWNVQLVTNNMRVDQMRDGSPCYRAIGLDNKGKAMVWWQPIFIEWWN